MATASANPTRSSAKDSVDSSIIKVALPYIIAIVAQVPMLCLFYRGLWAKAHYSTFPFAIIATVAIVAMRWPHGERMPNHSSLSSDILMLVGLMMGLASVLFVEPWFTAASVLFLVASFLARTVDPETKRSLWPAVLPLFVFLPLPFGKDIWLITWLQRMSAWFTSRLLDLLGLGHHLDGTIIHVPGKDGYGIAEACSGVQSFFTLLFVCSVFIVLNRRTSSSPTGFVVFSFLALIFFAISLVFPGYWLAVVAIGFLLWGLLGFRAAALVMSAVFWAMFINTIRILVIPVLDMNFNIDLAHGLGHDLLGWFVLFIGCLLLLSTDQLILFLFGPVDAEAGEAGPFGKLITNFWNQIVSGEREKEGKRKRKGRQPISQTSRMIAWGVAGILLLGGLFQLSDVYRSYNQPNLTKQFFDANVMQPFSENDLPVEFENWKRLEGAQGYQFSKRERGSDLGLRSDIWQFRAPRCNASASLDQTFPGWHELTTCYQNQGWKLVDRQKIESKYPGQEDWGFIQAKFERNTGEKAFLLFSLFNGAGQPIDPPANWGTITSFFERAKNRLSNRIRRGLFSAEAYQTQVFIQHFKDLDAPLKTEIAERYMAIRGKLREEFVKKAGIPMPTNTAGGNISQLQTQ